MAEPSNLFAGTIPNGKKSGENRKKVVNQTPTKWGEKNVSLIYRNGSGKLR